MARMPPPSPPLDNRLARLGREWFAEVRERDRAEMRAVRATPDADATADVAGDARGGRLDWLFGDRADTCDDPGGSDCGGSHCGD